MKLLEAGWPNSVKPPLTATSRLGSAFRISFHFDWQIDNGIFNGPIMARSQILVRRWGPRT